MHPAGPRSIRAGAMWGQRAIHPTMGAVVASAPQSTSIWCDKSKQCAKELYTDKECTKDSQRKDKERPPNPGSLGIGGYRDKDADQTHVRMLRQHSSLGASLFALGLNFNLAPALRLIYRAFIPIPMIHGPLSASALGRLGETVFGNPSRDFTLRKAGYSYPSRWVEEPGYWLYEGVFGGPSSDKDRRNTTLEGAEGERDFGKKVERGAGWEKTLVVAKPK
ncbi:hypothetical protein DFH06DRAFT_1148705 [Mycena polygramma]|nr:hypothetical protein DFH06DRAFT_1148705 [Mycena polygramma]